jgi:DNA-binding transcriptional ArsR family regulator
MSLDRFSPGSDVELAVAQDTELVRRMESRAVATAAFMKALSHEGRLMILCHLAAGEKSVTELEALLGQRQAAVSQQLARLRLEGLVATRREGKAIFYRLHDARVLALLRLLPGMFGKTV